MLDSEYPVIRVVLVDDELVVLEGLKPLIECDDRMRVVGAVRSGEEALALVDSVECDIVVTDLSMPGMGGIEATRQLKGQSPAPKVLVLTGYGESHLTKAIKAGADGYIMKTAGGDKLRAAIRDIHAGGSALDPALARTLFQRVAGSLSSRESSLPVRSAS